MEKFKVKKAFRDLMKGVMRKEGEVFEVDEARAKELSKRPELVEQFKEEKADTTTKEDKKASKRQTKSK